MNTPRNKTLHYLEIILLIVISIGTVVNFTKADKNNTITEAFTLLERKCEQISVEPIRIKVIKDCEFQKDGVCRFVPAYEYIKKARAIRYRYGQE